MEHKDLVSQVADNMAAATSSTEDDLDNKFFDMEHAYDEMREEEKAKRIEDEAFEIKIPMCTGEVFILDARNVDWEHLNSRKADMLENEESIRGLVYALLTADHVGDPEGVEELTNTANQELSNFMESFGIKPGYDKLPTQVKPYILALAKCFDAISVMNVMKHNVELHALASQIFSIEQDLKNVADINDLTEIDNDLGGLISDDRKNFTPDDHDVSGLITE